MAKKTRKTRKAEKLGEAEQARPCHIVWLGLNKGPAYAPVASWSEDKDLPEEFAGLTAAFRESYGETTDKEDVRKFGKAMKEYAEENGWKVESSVYDEKLSEAMDAGQEAAFMEAMRTGWVDFRFRKVDGTLREARGTRCPDLMPQRPPAGEAGIQRAERRRVVPPTVICFWDAGGEGREPGWRSFRKDLFEGWERARLVFRVRYEVWEKKEETVDLEAEDAEEAEEKFRFEVAVDGDRKRDFEFLGAEPVR